MKPNLYFSASQTKIKLSNMQHDNNEIQNNISADRGSCSSRLEQLENKLRLLAIENQILNEKFTTERKKCRLLEETISNNKLINGKDEVNSCTTEKEMELTELPNNHPSGKDLVITPKQFGITVYNPENMDLLTHVEKVNQAAQEAEEFGASEKQKNRLLMKTLPPEMAYVEYFIPPEKQNSYREFSNEVVNILGDKVRIRMEQFLLIRREPEENLLKYLVRMLKLYKTQSMGNDWEENPHLTPPVYSKVYAALTPEEKVELNIRLDGELELGKLTISKLKEVFVHISKMNRKMKNEIPKHNVSPKIMSVENRDSLGSKNDDVKLYYEYSSDE